MRDLDDIIDSCQSSPEHTCELPEPFDIDADSGVVTFMDDPVDLLQVWIDGVAVPVPPGCEIDTGASSLRVVGVRQESPCTNELGDEACAYKGPQRGCDKTFADCVGRFKQGHRFGGELR